MNDNSELLNIYPESLSNERNLIDLTHYLRKFYFDI